jgi:hypothetical protein
MRARIEAENEFEQMHFTISIYLVKYIELMHQFVLLITPCLRGGAATLGGSLQIALGLAKFVGSGAC